MATYVPQTENTAYVASIDDETYILSTLITINAGTQDAFNFAPGTTGSTFVVDGVARAFNQFRSAISNNGGSNTVEISQSGNVSGDYTIENNSGTLDVTNHGLIEASGRGIVMHGNGGHIVNTGQIISGGIGIAVDSLGRDDPSQGRFTISNDGFIYGGISTEAVGLTIELGKNSEIFCKGAAIISTGTGDTDVDNLGLIRTTGINAFIGSQNGVDIFTNSGRVVGSIDLKGNDDIFKMKGGVIEGTVIGGQGDDTFILAKGSPLVRELAGQGDDTLKTAVSFEIGADNEFETIILTGKRNISFVADASANEITGNKANNIIDGGFGNDTITGGRGRDTFVQRIDGDLDTITDFTQGQDKLKIDIDGIDRFADLTVTKVGDAVLIDMGNGDQFLIENGKVGSFDRHDFLFG